MWAWAYVRKGLRTCLTLAELFLTPPMDPEHGGAHERGAELWF